MSEGKFRDTQTGLGDLVQMLQGKLPTRAVILQNGFVMFMAGHGCVAMLDPQGVWVETHEVFPCRFQGYIENGQRPVRFASYATGVQMLFLDQASGKYVLLQSPVLQDREPTKDEMVYVVTRHEADVQRLAKTKAIDV